jgi:archaellum biogenesis ATPase FlaH
MTEGGLALLRDEPALRRPPPEDDELGMDVNQGTAQQLLGLGKRYVVRDDEDYDFAIVDGLSVYLYDKTVREVIDVVRQITAQLKQNRSFMVPLQTRVVGERTSSYLKAQADSVIVVRTEIAADRVLRSLQLQKMRGSYPSDKLVKFTLDENGIQVDTREFLG